MTNPRLIKGHVSGYLYVLGIAPDDPKPTSYNKKKRVKVRCSGPLLDGVICGRTFIMPEYYLKRDNPKTHCGCQTQTLKSKYNREYRIWCMMHERTENPKHVAYHHYGLRGIRVCDEWNKAAPDGKGFERFLEFVGPAPSELYSIDRIDNDLGYQPYHPVNKNEDGSPKRQVKWSTASEQRANQRPYTNRS